MKQYSSLIHTVVITLLVLTVGYLVLLETGIITSMNPQKGQPKYSDNTGMSVILTFIGIVFALFAFLTFQSVKDLFEGKIREIGYKQNESDKKHNKQVHKLEELEDEMVSVLATLMNISAHKSFNSEENWLGLYYGVNSALFYSRKITKTPEEKISKDSAVEEMLNMLLHRLNGKVSINAETYKQVEDISKKIIINTNMKSGVLLGKILEKCEIIEKP